MTVAKKVAMFDLVDQLLVDYQKPEDLIGEHGLPKQLTKAVVERALQAEMAAHLGHGKHGPVANAAGNARNGTSRKTLKGEFGELPIEIPRDRQGSPSTGSGQASSRSSSPNIKPAGRALTTRYCPCTPVA